MVGQVGKHAPTPRTCERLQCLGDAQVQLGAAQDAQPVVQRATHELVREAVRQRREGQLLDHPAAHRWFQRVDPLELDGRGVAQDVELELGAGNGGQLEQVAARRIESAQALTYDLTDALRRCDFLQRSRQPERAVVDREHVCLDERAPELAEQEGVALGEVAQRAGELGLGGVELAAAGAAHELPDVLLAQPAQVEADDVVGAAQVCKRVGELGRDVGLGVSERRHHEHAGLGARAGEVAQEHERGRVGPVPVLEHEQQRLPATRGGQDVGHCRVQTVALGVRVGGDGRREPGNERGQVGNEPGQLAARAAEVRTERVGVGAASELAERLGEGSVGSLHHGVAGAVEHAHAFRGEHLRQLPHEATLAGTGLAAQQREPTTLTRLARHQRSQRRELRRAPDERRGRRESQRAGQRLHVWEWAVGVAGLLVLQRRVAR